MDNRDKRPVNNNNKRPKFEFGFFFYIVIFALLLFVGSQAFGGTGANSLFGKSEESSLSDVMDYIENESHNVESVDLNGTTVTIKYTEEGSKVTKQITHRIPYEFVDDFLSFLEQAKSEGKVQSYNYVEPVDWGSIIYIVLIAGGIILVVFFFSNLSKQTRGDSVFSFGNNRAKLSNPSDNKVRFKDVAGANEEKVELQEIVDFLKNPEKYHKLGAKIPKGFLLFGVPGTGKTLLARAVAGEANVPFFYLSGSDFVEMLVGAGASRVRSLFADAKKAAPCVIFIDEIDAVGRKRGAGLGGGNDEREQTLNQILVEMDGFDVNTNIIVLAATNRPDVLDPALLRPGRFDRQVMIMEPDVDDREAILKVHVKGKPLDSDVDLRELAMSTTGFTGADLSNLLNEAALLTARRNKSKISSLEITDAMFRVMMGPEKSSKKLTDKVKKLTAYHEAGHAILNKAVCGDFNKVDRVTIIPAGQAGGYTAYKPTEDMSYYTERMLRGTIIMALGGRAAEEIFLGEISTGASSDLQQCNRIATNMIKRYGLSSKFKNMVFGSDSEEVFIGGSYGQVQSYSDETAAQIDEEIQKIIDECYEEAKRILLEKKGAVEGLASTLIKKLKVDNKEFEEIFDNNGVLIREEENVQVDADTSTNEDKSVKDSESSDKTSASDGDVTSEDSSNIEKNDDSSKKNSEDSSK